MSGYAGILLTPQRIQKKQPALFKEDGLFGFTS